MEGLETGTQLVTDTSCVPVSAPSPFPLAGAGMARHSGRGCKAPVGNFDGTTAMKPRKTSSVMNEPHNACFCFIFQCLSLFFSGTATSGSLHEPVPRRPTPSHTGLPSRRRGGPCAPLRDCRDAQRGGGCQDRNAHAIPYAAMSETSSNCWKFSVINEASCWEYLVDKPSRTSWMAA